MRSALFPLSIQDGCCRSREPTVWGQLIAGNVYARRASRIDPASLLTTAPIGATLSVCAGGGRSWWAHVELTRINIAPTMLPKEIEELRVFRASRCCAPKLRLFTSREVLDRGTRRAGAR